MKPGRTERPIHNGLVRGCSAAHKHDTTGDPTATSTHGSDIADCTAHTTTHNKATSTAQPPVTLPLHSHAHAMRQLQPHLSKPQAIKMRQLPNGEQGTFQ